MPRPSKNILSTSTIARAALKLVETKGDFTIPGVAAALKVNPSSLYHHLPGGRSEIVHRMREELYARIDLAPLVDAGVSPLDRLRTWMREVRAALANAPSVVTVLVASPVQDPRTLEIYETLFVILRDAGVPADDRVAFSAMIDAVVLGSAIDAGSPAPLWRPTPAPDSSEAVTASPLSELVGVAASGDDRSRVQKGLDLAVETVVAAVASAGRAADR